MKFKSHPYSQASGSIGGTTYSHNRGGMYVRSRAIPADPNSIYQQAIRGFVAALTSAWTDTLTAAQRAAWDTYAENVLMANALGEQINIGGLAHYCRSNVPRLQAGLDRVDAGPTTYNLGEFTNPSFSEFAAGGQTFDVGFDEDDAWVDEDGAAMLIYGSRSQSPGRNYFKGPYRYADAIEGDSTTPPTTPFEVSNPFEIVADNKTFVLARVTRADGRLSLPFRSFGTGGGLGKEIS